MIYVRLMNNLGELINLNRVIGIFPKTKRSAARKPTVKQQPNNYRDGRNIKCSPHILRAACV